AVGTWLGARPRDWLAQVAMVALDPWRGYASALVAPLGHARVVVDHFHAIRLANTVVDQVRRRTQQATLGHRGRTRAPCPTRSSPGPAGGPNRPPSGIGAASAIRCTASASCC